MVKRQIPSNEPFDHNFVGTRSNQSTISEKLTSKNQSKVSTLVFNFETKQFPPFQVQKQTTLISLKVYRLLNF